MKEVIPIGAALVAVLVFGYFANNAVDHQQLTDTFNRIYMEGAWGKDVVGHGTRGTGSTLEITREYRVYIEDFVKERGVTSVVDAGSGDWTFSRAIDWGARVTSGSTSHRI